MYFCQSVHCLTSLLKLFQQWIYPVLDDLSFTYFLETFLICQYNSFYEFLYTGLKLLHSFCLSVSLFVTSLDSDGLSLATGDFLLVSGVNFDTSGLVWASSTSMELRINPGTIGHNWESSEIFSVSNLRLRLYILW